MQQRRKSLLPGRRGQAYLEFLISLPVFLFLFGLAIMIAWYWWMQASAAVALHEGTRVAAVEGGSTAQGLQTTEWMLRQSLGPYFGPRVAGGAAIVEVPPLRSVMGMVRYDAPPNFLGGILGTVLWERPWFVRASSFQRREKFYPGPPQAGWE